MKTRELGILEGKAKVEFKKDFKITEEEFLEMGSCSDQEECKIITFHCQLLLPTANFFQSSIFKIPK